MPDFLKALVRVLTTPVAIGGAELSLARILGALLLFFVVLGVSKALRSLLRARVFPRFGIERGLAATFLSVLHYAFVIIGAWVALAFIGANLTGLAVVAGLLSVGVGFGLQNIVSNFICGLILLFERPIKVGDRVTVGDVEGDVEAINLRSTTVRTPQNISIIVPNSEFVTSQVVNWSYGDRKIRIHVPVGVAYGSDVALVTKVCLEQAKRHPKVLDNPEPKVWFVGFGDSSLNFELLAWIPDPVVRPETISDLNYAIDGAFRDNGIEIPFPQRDLHVRRGELLPVRVHANANVSPAEATDDDAD